ncbi:hypothetical protein [Streptomyces sp. Ac-502]|uniref:hypothetical protein n=1 Tax=Streptomyces sp. Ac-502 TaxID=3342801 RepID=UPI003862A4AF
MPDRFTIGVKVRGLGLALAVVGDRRDVRPPATAEELEQLETDVLAGFALARVSAGLADGTIRGDVGHLELTRSWFGRPLWETEPPDADAYFGKVLRASPSGTRLGALRRATLERLCVDRQLEEAMVHGPGQLHLAEVFGLDEKTAMRYANSARALLEQAAEHHLR